MVFSHHLPSRSAICASKWRSFSSRSFNVVLRCFKRAWSSSSWKSTSKIFLYSNYKANPILVFYNVIYYLNMIKKKCRFTAMYFVPALWCRKLLNEWYDILYVARNVATSKNCNISQETKSSSIHDPYLCFEPKSSKETMLH